MADNVDKISLDTSGYDSALSRLAASLKKHGQEVDSVGLTYVEFGKRGSQLQAGFEATLSTGEKLDGFFKRSKSGIDAYVASIDKVTTATKAMAAAQSIQAGAGVANIIMKGIVPDTSGMKASMLDAYRSVQQDLAKAIGDGPNVGIANEIFTKLKAGVIDVETGIRGKIQGALLDVLRLSERINAEQSKINRVVTPRSAIQDANMQAGQGAAATLIKGLIPDTTAMRAALLDSFRTIQQDLAKAIGGDPANVGIANEIFTKLKAGVVEVETGIRGKIQGALLDVLRLSERITAEQAKINKPSAPVGATSMSGADLSSARGQVTSVLPIDTRSSISSIASYQASINALMSTVARSKITLQQFQLLFSNVSRNPTQDFAGTNQQLGQVQSGIQRVVMAYNTMKQAAQSAGETGQRVGQTLFVSFDQFVKLLEVQIIHRIFGNLITSMQGAISKAAELQVKIAEVMTLAQGSGIDQGQVENFVRSRSETFNRPQTDVAEGLYAGLSNQVIKTSADLGVMDAALQLSRTTVSSVGVSVNALSSVMRSYNLTNADAQQTAAELFRIVDLGRFRLTDIADSLGRVTVVGGQMGVSFQEIGAIMTHLSVTGLTSSETMTQVSAIMNTFLKPSEALSRVLRSWGFETGEAAVRTLTLTGAIRRLHEEVDSGRVTLGEVSPNIRSMRGLAGSRDFDAIRSNQNAISNAMPGSNAAGEVVEQNIGTKFQQEIEKVRNAMLDFGKTAIVELTKFAEPWGGISAVVVQVGTAFGDAAKLGLEFLSTMNSLLALVKPLGVDLGTLVKWYLTYKAAVMGVNLAIAAGNAVMAIYAGLNAQALTMTTSTTAALTLERLARFTSAAATTGQAGALATATAAQAVNTGAAATATLGQFALAAATRVANAAMIASPFIAVGLLVAGFTGQLDALTHQFSELKSQIDAISSTSERLRTVTDRMRQDQESAVRAREGQFTNTLERTQRQGGDIFAELTRRSNELVDAQRNVVRSAGENVKIAMKLATDAMGQAISDVNRKITEADNQVKQSLRRQSAFADRNASTNFSNMLSALGHKPEFITPINTDSNQGQEQYRQEEVRFRIEAQQFDLQKQLIQQRINTLTQEAQQLTRSGNREDIESSRRKFEEVRRLTQQQFDLQTGFNRREAEHNILTGRQSGGLDGVLQYNIPVQRLQADLERLTQTERAAEQAIRSRQAAIAATAERERAGLIQKQEALNLAIKSMQDLNVLDQSGAVNRRYQGQGGMQNFNQDFASRRAALEQALSATTTDAQGRQTSIVSPEAQAQIRSTLFIQFSAMQSQLQREVAAEALRHEQNLFNTRLENIRRLRTEMVNAESNANQARSQLLNDVGTETARMAGEVRDADTRLQSRNTFHPFRDGPGQDVVNERRDRFTATLPELNAAREAFAVAGPNEQVAAQTRLQAAIDTTSMAYRRLFALAGNRTIAGSTQTGTQVLENQTPLQQSAQRLRSANADAATTRADIEQSTLQLNGLRGEVERAAAAMGIGGNVLGIINQNAAAAVPAVETFTGAISRLADQFDRLRNASIPALPGAANEASPEFVGPRRAMGGLIGTGFNTRGPDNVMAMVRTGEFVVNPESTSRFYSQLVAMNAGQMPSFAQGGMVGGSSVTNVGDISINVHESGDPNATARAVLGLMRRETRRGNGRM